MFRKIGIKIDNKIQDIKDLFYAGKIYRIYARVKMRYWIKNKRYENRNHLANHLEYAIKRGWFTAEESKNLLSKWR